MFKKLLTIASLTAFAASALGSEVGETGLIEAFLSDNNPYYTSVHDKIMKEDVAFKLTDSFASAEESCRGIRDALADGKYDNLKDLVHRWAITAYGNEALPISGLYFGHSGLASLGQRIGSTVDIKKKDIKVAAADNGRDTCVLRIKHTGTFRTSKKDYNDLVMYISLRFHLGKAILIGLFDGHTSKDAMRLYREGTSEGIAYEFAKTVYKHGFEDEKTLAMLTDDCKFGFSSLGHDITKFEGKKEFGNFGKYVKGVRQGFKNLRLPLPFFAHKSKMCRTVSVSKNGVSEACAIVNVKSRTNTVHKYITFLRAIVLDEKSRKVRGVFIHVLNNMRAKDIDPNQDFAIAAPTPFDDTCDIDTTLFGDFKHEDEHEGVDVVENEDVLEENFYNVIEVPTHNW